MAREDLRPTGAIATNDGLEKNWVPREGHAQLRQRADPKEEENSPVSLSTPCNPERFVPKKTFFGAAAGPTPRDSPAVPHH